MTNVEFYSFSACFVQTGLMVHTTCYGWGVLPSQIGPQTCKFVAGTRHRAPARVLTSPFWSTTHADCFLCKEQFIICSDRLARKRHVSIALLAQTLWKFNSAFMYIMLPMLKKIVSKNSNETFHIYISIMQTEPRLSG
jgi:hypothetical protein